MSNRTQETPAVSILMPVHNGLPYLTDALDDLLAQTFSDFELIVVDDASTDGSTDVVQAYAEKDDRIVVITNEENVGLPASLNKGLEHCRAPLVARADDDDRYAPDRIERQVEFMEENPEVGVLSSSCHKIDEDGERFKTVHHPIKDGEIRLRELFVNSFSHPGIMFRRDLVQGVGGYNTDFWTAEDVDLWARLRPLTRMANLPEPLLAYRKHGSSMMQSNNQEVLRMALSVRKRLLEDYLQRQLSQEETEAIVSLFRGWRVSGDNINAGREALWEVLDKAKDRESPEAVTFYKRELARSLLQQASYLDDSDRKYSRVLFQDAIRLDPSLALSLKAVKQAAKSFLPAQAVDAVRKLKSNTKRLLKAPLAGRAG